MLAPEATGLIINTAMGLIKLSKRIDLLWAEKTALERPMALPLAVVAMPPTQPQMLRSLRKLLDETKDASPDPLAKRADIVDAVSANPDNATLFGFMQKYLPKQALGDVLDLDGKFIRELQKTRPDLAADRDIVVSAFYISAGADIREKSYTWRLALTVVDTIADFGAENAALFTRDESVQSVVRSVLTRFGDADVQTIDSSSDLLRIALSSTLNGVLDNKSVVESDKQWLNAVLDALVEVRASVPAAERDNFIAGLLQGQGYPLLVASLLENGAGILLANDKQNFGDTAAAFLQEVATIVEQKPSFKNFLQDHWSDMLRAGFSSLKQHGPILLNDSDPLLKEIMVGVLSNLARSPNNKLLTTDMLVGIIDTAISVVSANPEQVKVLVKQEWLGVFISSFSTTIAQEGVQNAFTKQGLEVVLKDTLSTFSEHPELIVDNPGLARDLLRELLASLSESNAFSADALASTAVRSALKTFAAHPELANTKYTKLVSSLAGKLATMVRINQLTKVQGRDILQSVVESLAENPQLFLDTDTGFAGMVIDAMIKASAKSGVFTSGITLVKSIETIIRAIASVGNAALKNHAVADLEDELEKLLSAGLVRAEKELGNQMSLSSVPDVLALLVEAWAKGKIFTIDPTNDNFRRVFSELAIKAGT